MRGGASSYRKEYKWVRSSEVINGLMKSLKWMGARIIDARITKGPNQKASISGELGDLIIKAHVDGAWRLFPEIKHFGKIPFTCLRIELAVRDPARRASSEKIKELVALLEKYLWYTIPGHAG